MKNYIYILISGILILISCKKNDNDPEPSPQPAADNVAPVLSLKGHEKDTVILGTFYNDPGASAIDDKDGDISPFVVVSGNVDANLKGDYIRRYNVRDAAGNKPPEKSRYIHVKNSAEYLDGNYNVAVKSTTSQPGAANIIANTSYNSVISTSQTQNNVFQEIFSTGNSTVALIITANGISLQASYPLGTFSGTIAASKTSFTVETSGPIIESPSNGRFLTCTYVYTKQ